MSCPGCGSSDAVSKSVAWDALHAIPAATQEYIHLLEDVLRAAAVLNPSTPDTELVCITVPFDAFEQLKRSTEKALAESRKQN